MDLIQQNRPHMHAALTCLPYLNPEGSELSLNFQKQGKKIYGKLQKVQNLFFFFPLQHRSLPPAHTQAKSLGVTKIASPNSSASSEVAWQAWLAIKAQPPQE